LKNIKDFLSFLNETLVGEKPITDMSKYLEGMSKGLSDKLFFLDKINPDLIVDFGSADGFVLNKIQHVRPDCKLIGYDIDEKMINISRQKYPNIQFTDNFSEIKKIVSQYDRPAIFLSSVIHEVYTYSTGKQVKKFWDDMFNSGFKWVVIRDMMPSKKYEKMNRIDIKKIREKSNTKYLKEFEQYWGNIGRDYRNLLHWLLKYRYLTNWERELKENYLPVTFETIKTKIPSDWKVIFEEHYVLPFLKSQVKKDFGIYLEEPTHLKMILEKK